MQQLFPAAFPEGVTFVRTHAGNNSIHIGELPGGGYSRIDGQAIQDALELMAVIPPGPRLNQALAWFEHREDAPPEDEPPAVTYRRGALVYVESGAELTSHAEIIQAFPEESPMQRAALEWFAGRQSARYQAHQRQDLQTGVLSGPTELPAAKPRIGRPPGRSSAQRIQSVMNTNDL